MSAHDFGSFLEASLAVLARETPRAAENLRARLVSHRLRFDTEEGTFLLTTDAAGHHVGRAAEEADVRLGLGRDVIAALVDGTLALEEALWTDRLVMFGDTSDLGGFFDAFHVYLEGAVRAPSFPLLFDAFKRGESVPQLAEEK